MSGSFDLMKLMKEAGKMQEMVSSQQEELAKKFYEAEAGAGMVKAKVNGALEVISLQAEQEALETLGLESVMDLAVAAINEAMKKARENVKGDMMSQLQNLAGGLFGGSDQS